MTRVLVVDDSAFMRRALTKMLESDPRIEVVGTARDGQDALDKIQNQDPDLVTLDVDMPRMNGLEALRHIMATTPRPVLMVSALTEAGAEETLQALDLGALDYIPKGTAGSTTDIVNIQSALCQKVKILARRRHRRPTAGERPRSAPSEAAAPSEPTAAAEVCGARFLAVGASTGGPPALQKMLSELAADFPAPVVVVQHMPKAFTGPFARRLNALCRLEIKEAESGDRLEPGRGFVAPGGSHLVVRKLGGAHTLLVTDEPAGTLHKPSVDVTFSSFAESIGSTTLAVVLTGMGSDGLEGVRKLRAAGGHAFTQDARSCVVYGMPRVVAEAGLSDGSFSIEKMVGAVAKAVQ